MAAPHTPIVTLPARVRFARKAYQTIAWVFAACLIVQIFVAGMGIFVDPARWSWHRNLAHAFEPLPILLIVLAFAGRLPVRMRWLSALPFGLLWLQYATAGIGGLAGAFHPVNAVLMFWVVMMLARRSEASVVSNQSKVAPPTGRLSPTNDM